MEEQLKMALQHERRFEDAEEYLRLLKSYKARLELLGDLQEQSQRAEVKHKLIKEFQSEFQSDVNQLKITQKLRFERRQNRWQEQNRTVLQQTNGPRERQQEMKGVQQQQLQQPQLHQHFQEKQQKQQQQTQQQQQQQRHQPFSLQLQQQTQHQHQQTQHQQRIQMQQNQMQFQQHQINMLQQNQQVMINLMLQSRKRESIHSTVVVNPRFNLPKQRREQKDQGVQNMERRQMLEDREPKSAQRVPSKRMREYEKMQQPTQKNSKKSAVSPDMPISMEQQRWTDKDLEPNNIFTKEIKANVGSELVATANDVLRNKENNSSGYNSDDSGESLVF